MRKLDMRWMVYYINKEGYREGNEYIDAANKDEAIEAYKRYFNVFHTECKAVPVFDG